MTGGQGCNMNVIAVGIIFVVCLHFTLSVSATDTTQCSTPDKAKRCKCHYENVRNDDLEVDNTGDEYDHRTLGLIAATGTLGGLLATGSALAAYFYFRGGGEALGEGLDKSSGGRGGGGFPSIPESTDTDSVGSNSPFTKRGDGDSKSSPSRSRPFTGASNSTNIYRHSKVWPGRF